MLAETEVMQLSSVSHLPKLYSPCDYLDSWTIVVKTPMNCNDIDMLSNHFYQTGVQFVLLIQLLIDWLLYQELFNISVAYM